MPTPFKYRDSDWECKGCQYLTLCEAEASTVRSDDAHQEDNPRRVTIHGVGEIRDLRRGATYQNCGTVGRALA